MITLSLDCSTSCTGYAVFNEDKLVHYGCIKPDGDSWRERLTHEGAPLSELIKTYKPNRLIVEEVPLKAANIKVLMILGAVQGYVLGIAASHHVPIQFVLPQKWRSDIGIFDGTREGTKRDVLKKKSVEKANELFGLDLNWVSPSSSKNDDDISDAILLGWSQIHK